MFRSIRWRFTMLALLSALTLCYLRPLADEKLPGWMRSLPPEHAFRLGLDLKGGLHLVLEADLDKAQEYALERARAGLHELLGEEKVRVPVLRVADGDHIEIELRERADFDILGKIIDEEFEDILVLDAGESDSMRRTLSLASAEVNRIESGSIDQILEILRNRIDRLGVTEPVIVKQGTSQIVVQLPDVKNPEEADRVLRTTGTLEFKLVDPAPAIKPQRIISEAKRDGRLSATPTPEELKTVLRNVVPEGREIAPIRIRNPNTGTERIDYLVLESQVLMTGDRIRRARIGREPLTNRATVLFELDMDGRGIFGEITKANVRRDLAIILDGVVQSAPRIREPILGGSGVISGSFSDEEAKGLTIVLREGALPAPIKVAWKVIVGATLGADSVRQGKIAALLATLLVVVFMIAYYRLSGIIAVFALGLNVLYLFGFLSAFGATLTLPGIAGIVLAIGMAVDSNVLIFERMREEFRVGKTVRAGVDAGYDKALWTIIDSHVTTLITAFVLFTFGTGPIKGFAVTLSLGVLINLFTALVGTRVVYDYLFQKTELAGIKFFQLVRETRIDFLALRRLAFAVSGVLVAIGILAFVQIGRDKGNLGVDFRGGTLIQLHFDEPVSIDEARAGLAERGFLDADLQEVADARTLLVRLRSGPSDEGGPGEPGTVEKVETALAELFPESGVRVESSQEIGATVSAKLKRDALVAVLISFVAIVIYLAWRFEFGFGLAAALTTFHDVFVVLGLFYVTGKEINLLIVTALLTLAGYSLTDTVVVFDRIRENMRRFPRESFDRVVNLSINGVLGRTVVTSLTTFFALAAIFFFGGTVLHNFALALMIGVAVGTYSSVFVASPLIYIWRGRTGRAAGGRGAGKPKSGPTRA